MVTARDPARGLAETLEPPARPAGDAAKAYAAVDADESDVWRACKYRPLGNDLEDDMVMTAAERAQARFTVTNDKELIRKAAVAAYLPEDAVAHLRATA